MMRQMVRGDRILALALGAAAMLCLANSASAQSNSGKVTKSPSASSAHDLNPEAKEIIAWAAKTYRIEVVWKNVSYPLVLREERKTLEGVNPSKEAAELVLPALKRALAKYPRDLLHTVGLSKIILGTQLKAGGVHIGGYSYPPSRSLILEINPDDRQPFKSVVLHHEIFHLIDKALLGQYSKQDIGWARLNGPKFKGYQSGDGWKWMASLQPGQAKPTAEPGFVSAYSMSSVAEDKAEVFGHLMEDPAALAELAEKDAVIRAKVARMKQLVRQASPKMDSKYFDKLAAAGKESER